MRLVWLKITTKRKVGQASNESLLSSLNPKLEAQNKNVEKLTRDVAGLGKEVKRIRKIVEAMKDDFRLG